MNAPTPERRWYHPTPDWLLFGLLAEMVFLILSERFGWVVFESVVTWEVLNAIASVAVFLLVMLVWWALALTFNMQFQFGIRSMLLLVVVIAIPCSWLAVKRKEKWEESQLVAAIEEMHGHAAYDYQTSQLEIKVYSEQAPGPACLRRVLGENFFTCVNYVGLERTRLTDDIFVRLKTFRGIRGLCLSESSVTDPGLRDLIRLDKLEWLDLGGTKITDAGLQQVKVLKKLYSLDLSYTQVTDTGLSNLVGLSRLRRLSLSATKVTGAGVRHLKDMNQLEQLDLGGTSVSDVGLESIKGLHLLTLNLNCTAVTDACIPCLESLHDLTDLGLFSTNITSEGEKRVIKALPNCSIQYSPNINR
jgi:hypothetical protein